ncbi:hypothetical protein UZ36_00740 [Candidatus Nitromaritima sp. SCGC AAA799-C22]|nr:hypothetical protein UZ36_00740 [Candidatus Nitromaritima sp. SCGC AAA799-C22]
MSLLISLFTIRVQGAFLGLCLLLSPAAALASSADGKAMEGMELYRQQKFDQASRKLREARDGKPDDPKLSYNLGNSLYKEGKFGDALQDFSKVAGGENSDPELQQKSAYNMGNALFRLGKLEESAASYKKALELDPADMDAKFNLEFVREQIEKKKQEEKKQDKSGQDKKNSQSGEPQDKDGEPDDSDRAENKDNQNRQPKPSTDKQDSNESQDNPSRLADALPPVDMTEEEAAQRLNSLTEDLKKFQRKQARDMESLFTYQGNDW